MTIFYGDNGSPSQIGIDVAGAGLRTDLFAQLFSLEVLEAYYANTIMRDKTMVKNISHGKSDTFPRLWKLSAAYHTPGQEMLGQTTSQTQKTIYLDGMLTAPFSLYDLDVAQAHYDVRAPYVKAAGRALAEAYDQNCMRTVIMGARESVTSPFPAGKRITTADVSGLSGFTGATLTTTPNALGIIGAARAIRIRLRELNVPDSIKFYGAISPVHFDMLKYARLSNDGTNFYGDMIFQKTDWNSGNPQGGFAGVSETVTIEGITFFASNLIPTTNQTNDDTVWSKYRADYSSVCGLVWSEYSIGTLELLGITIEMQRDARRIESFTAARMAVGHGPLVNEFCFEITKLASV